MPGGLWIGLSERIYHIRFRLCSGVGRALLEDGFAVLGGNEGFKDRQHPLAVRYHHFNGFPVERIAVLQGLAVGTQVIDSVSDRVQRGVKVKVQ